jgi:hypothetical protein
MKKVKVKTKQKQKQKQTQIVNVNLGNILKKSQSKRKSQPKAKQFYSAQSSGGPSISFNAPPIREYVDTSLNNRQSTLENPLLIKNTTNPTTSEVGFSNNPLLIEPPKEQSFAQKVGQYLLQSSISDQEMKERLRLMNTAYENKQISDLEQEARKTKNKDSVKKQQESIRSQIPDDIKTPKKTRGPYKKKQKPELPSIQESPSTQELNQPEESITSTNPLITSLPVETTLTSEPATEPNIKTGIETDEQRAERFLQENRRKKEEIKAFNESQKSKPIDEKKNEYIKNASSPRTTRIIDEPITEPSLNDEPLQPAGILEGLGTSNPPVQEDVKDIPKKRGPKKSKEPKL